MEVLEGSFRFNVGQFECLVIRDTTSPMYLEGFFPDIPQIQLKRLLSQYDIPHGETFEVMCLFIRTEKHAVLIDTGWGAGVLPNSGNLIKNLQAEGIQCSGIDTVILSHGHPDHIGGNTDVQGRVAFPNARYIIRRDEWEFWTSGPDLSKIDEDKRKTMLAVAQKNLIPIKGQFELLEEETEIVPGIRSIRTPGHTPGHIALVISSGTEQLLYIGDLAHHPIQFARTDLCIPLDVVSEQARSTRAQILRRMAGKNMLLFACHFSFPGLGRVTPRGDTYLWQPIKIKDK